MKTIKCPMSETGRLRSSRQARPYDRFPCDNQTYRSLADDVRWSV